MQETQYGRAQTCNDFGKPDGALSVPAASKTMPHIQQLLESARAHNVRIAYTQDTHVEGDSEWEIWPEHVRTGTWGWEIIEELKPHSEVHACEVLARSGADWSKYNTVIAKERQKG